MKTKLIDKSNLWFALASTLIFLSIYALGGSLLTAFLVPFISSIIVEVALYYFPFEKRLSGMALFVRLTTTLLIPLILFYSL